MEKLRYYEIKGGYPLEGEVTVSGAKNAALYAISIMALSDDKLAIKLDKFRAEQTLQVYNADKELQEELKSIG